MENAIIKQVKAFASITSGNQKLFFMRQLNDMKEIEITPIAEVFSKEEIKRIKRVINPRKKECYKNATLLCELFHDAQYVEGYITCLNGAIPIEHAWNKVKGKYVDITKEIALKSNDKETYMMLGEWNINEVREVMLETGFYGNIYNEKFLNELKQ